MFGQVELVDRILCKLEQVVAVQEDRCVRLKHKRSTCQDCVINCPTGAIRVGKVREHIHIDWQKCIACGICTNVCRTEVYSLKAFTDRDLLDRGRGVVQAYKNLEIRCSKADGESGTPAVEVNCLGFINPVHIIAFAANGAQAIHFRHADCGDCEAKCGDKHASKAIRTAENILEAFNRNKKIILSVGKRPASFTLPPGNGNTPRNGELLSRREFFKYFKRQAQFFTATTITALWDSEQRPARHPLDFTNKFVPARRQLLLAVLQTFGTPDEDLLDTSDSSILTGMEIDPSKCGLCESCARFCPTGALTQRSVLDARGKRLEGELKFRPAQCVKCDLCLVACFTQALKYADQLDKHLFIGEREHLLKRVP